MKLLVGKYRPPPDDFHECVVEDGDGRKVYVDIMVDGAFRGIQPEEMTGKTIECRSIDGFVYIANGVQPLDAAPSRTGEKE